MTNIILHGCKGRMGQAIIQLISQSENLNLAAGIDSNTDGTESYPAFSRIKDCNIAGDVLIDFSHYSAVEDVLAFCIKKSIPAVIATTALGDSEHEAIKSASQSIPVFNSFNMSLGINAIASLMKTLVPLLENDFNIEIVEKHHNKKKDSPSGTALLLADSINDACQKKKQYIYGRNGSNDDCNITDLGIHSVRGGTIPGEHTIIFAGPDEVIEITHTALSRNIFANGALRAAEFMVKKEKGLYSMKDLI
ncbi:MAG: 4-hydroxy-tetrahydrodipicolinate reductase [Peptostreptococcaceae bacterium]|nr:4-hydroxy-tetrahydrodipicolinate reductase [Peptostreptococcaceae bacterium]